MRGFLMNREGAVAVVALPTSAASVGQARNDGKVSLVDAVLANSVEINGQIIQVTVADILAITGGAVGAVALMFSIYKHFRK